MDQLCFASGLTSSEWASWVQAVGSIDAIAAGALAIRWQVKEQHAEDRRRDVMVELHRVVHHEPIEAWILEQAGIEAPSASEVQGGLRVVSAR